MTPATKQYRTQADGVYFGPHHFDLGIYLKLLDGFADVRTIFLQPTANFVVVFRQSNHLLKGILVIYLKKLGN